MVDVYVAAGSNIEPERHLGHALEAIEGSFGPIAVSPAYRNKAVGFEGLDFVNLVVRFQTDQAVRAVRERLQEIEALCERPRDAPKWAPRTMDLDILLYGEQVSVEVGLVLPRPDLTRRAYMLKPMADLAPNLLHPLERRSMRELLESRPGAEHGLTEVSIPRFVPRPPPGSAL